MRAVDPCAAPPSPHRPAPRLLFGQLRVLPHGQTPRGDRRGVPGAAGRVQRHGRGLQKRGKVTSDAGEGGHLWSPVWGSCSAQTARTAGRSGTRTGRGGGCGSGPRGATEGQKDRVQPPVPAVSSPSEAGGICRLAAQDVRGAHGPAHILSALSVPRPWGSFSDPIARRKVIFPDQNCLQTTVLAVSRHFCRRLRKNSSFLF